MNGLSPPDTQRGWLQRLCYERLQVHLAEGSIPTSVRFVYYELKPGLPDRSSKRLWSQDVSDALMVLRQLGMIPWGWLTDEKRQLTTWPTAGSVYEYLMASVGHARIDPWRGSPPMIICESHSLAGVLNQLAYEYAASIISTSGQAGGVLHTDVIPALVPEQRIVYLGDLNAAGDDIENNTRRVLQEAQPDLCWTRLLLTPEQVRTHDLPSKETIDRRYRDRRAAESWEAEALGQKRIVGLLRDWLDACLPEPLAAVRVREAAQQARMVQELDRLRQDPR